MSDNVKLVRINTKIEVHQFEYQWNIENFRFSCNRSPGKALNSPIFTIPGTKVKGFLKVYPNGIREAHKDYVSVYLELKNYEDADLMAKFILWIPQSEDSVTSSKLVNFSLKESFGYPEFIKRDDLLNSEILEDETLTLMCDISVSTGVMKSSYLDDEIMSVESSLVEDFEQLLKEQSHTDVTLKIGNQRFEAHKLILSARCKTFKKMFADNPNKREFEISYIPVEFMNDFLQYVYTGKIAISGLKLMEFWKTVYFYEMNKNWELRKKCENQLINEINNDTAADLMSFAEDYDFDPLYYESLEYIIKNLSSVVRTKGYKSAVEYWPELPTRILMRLAEKNITIDSL